MKPLVLRLFFAIVPPCFRRFPDGWCFYLSGGKISALNRLNFSGFHWATWSELSIRYRRYWRQLPVKVGGHGKDW